MDIVVHYVHRSVRTIFIVHRAHIRCAMSTGHTYVVPCPPGTHTLCHVHRAHIRCAMSTGHTYVVPCPPGTHTLCHVHRAHIRCAMSTGHTYVVPCPPGTHTLRHVHRAHIRWHCRYVSVTHEVSCDVKYSFLVNFAIGDLSHVVVCLCVKQHAVEGHCVRYACRCTSRRLCSPWRLACRRHCLSSRSSSVYHGQSGSNVMVVLRRGACLSTIRRNPVLYVATMSLAGASLFISSSKEVISRLKSGYRI